MLYNKQLTCLFNIISSALKEIVYFSMQSNFLVKIPLYFLMCETTKLFYRATFVNSYKIFSET